MAKGKFKLQIINKSALKRLIVLFSILLILSFWLWWMMFWMPGHSYNGQLPILQSEEVTLQESLQRDISKLTTEIGVRNYAQYENLNTARNFLVTAFSQAGYTIKQQEYQVEGKSYYNIEVERKGTTKPEEVVLIGGHYDSVFTSPGANDNGTGAIATLELARIFANRTTNRTIRFVEFTNEEPLYLAGFLGWDGQISGLFGKMATRLS